MFLFLKKCEIFLKENRYEQPNCPKIDRVNQSFYRLEMQRKQLFSQFCSYRIEFPKYEISYLRFLQVIWIDNCRKNARFFKVRGEVEHAIEVNKCCSYKL